MSRLFWVSCAVLLFWVSPAELAWGQVCRQPDAAAELVRQDLARYAFANHPDDKAVRDSLRLPQSGRVSVITSESVCKKANHWGPDSGYYTVVIFDSRWRKLSSYTP